MVVGGTARFFTKKNGLSPQQPVFLRKKNGLSPALAGQPGFFTKKKRAVKPFFKKNGLLTRCFTKKKRAVSFADYSPFFFW